MAETFADLRSIPEELGFAAVPDDRTRKYSVDSYRAQYMLLKHQAERFHADCKTHQEMLRRIYQLLAQDPAYVERVRKGYPPHLPKIDQQEAEELMAKLGRTPWSEVGKDLT